MADDSMTVSTYFFEFTGFQPKAKALYDTMEQRWPEMLQSNSQVDVSLPCLEAGRKQHGILLMDHLGLPMVAKRWRAHKECA